MSAPIAALQPVIAEPSLAPLVLPGQLGLVHVPGAGFGQMVSEGLTGVDRALAGSQADMQALAAGDAGSLHQVMIDLEEARLSFQLMMQVRNRVLEAYQDVMKMQV